LYFSKNAVEKRSAQESFPAAYAINGPAGVYALAAYAAGGPPLLHQSLISSTNQII
jgi:hypothetical protein